MTEYEHRDERGASAVEYGLLISGVAALIVAVVFLFGGTVTGLFAGTCKTVNDEAVARGVAAAANCG